MRKILATILVLFSSAVLSDSIFDSGCAAVTFTALLKMTCTMPDGTTQDIPMTVTSTGQTTTTTATTPTTTHSSLPENIHCSITANQGTLLATLYAVCNPTATSWAWSNPTCSSAYNWCQVLPPAGIISTYTVVGSNATGTSNVASVTIVK